MCTSGQTSRIPHLPEGLSKEIQEVLSSIGFYVTRGLVLDQDDCQYLASVHANRHEHGRAAGVHHIVYQRINNNLNGQGDAVDKRMQLRLRYVLDGRDVYLGGVKTQGITSKVRYKLATPQQFVIILLPL